MTILLRIRKLYEEFFAPLGRIGARIGLTPDFWTFVSLGAAALSGVMFANRRILGGIEFIALMAFGDVMDGSTARALGKESRFGGILDHVSDRYAEYFILTGILLGGLAPPGWVLFAAFGMVMSSYVRAKAESMGGLESCNVGLAGRTEKMVILLAGMVVEVLGIGQGGLQWAVLLAGLVSHITALQRMLYSRRALTQSSAD